jgi:hypothetical protein
MNTPGGGLRLRPCLLLRLPPCWGYAQPLPGMSSPMARPSTTAFSLTTVPCIDGQVLDDEAWRTVAPSSGFTQV